MSHFGSVVLETCLILLVAENFDANYLFYL